MAQTKENNKNNELSKDELKQVSGGASLIEDFDNMDGYLVGYTYSSTYAVVKNAYVQRLAVINGNKRVVYYPVEVSGLTAYATGSNTTIDFDTFKNRYPVSTGTNLSFEG